MRERNAGGVPEVPSSQQKSGVGTRRSALSVTQPLSPVMPATFRYDAVKSIPAFPATIILQAPRPLRGAIMRRREAGRDAVSLRAGSQSGARGGVGLPPGPLRGPARSWLTTVRSIPNAGDRLLSTAFNRGETEPKRDERIAAGHLRRKRGRPRITSQWRAERCPPLPATEAEP
jgi:hypothetical protein